MVVDTSAIVAVLLLEDDAEGAPPVARVGAEVTKSGTPSLSTSPITRAIQPKLSLLFSPFHSAMIFVSSTKGFAKSAAVGTSAA